MLVIYPNLPFLVSGWPEMEVALALPERTLHRNGNKEEAHNADMRELAPPIVVTAHKLHKPRTIGSIAPPLCQQRTNPYIRASPIFLPRIHNDILWEAHHPNLYQPTRQRPHQRLNHQPAMVTDHLGRDTGPQHQR